MNRDEALAMLRSTHRGVLATLGRDGRPHQSNVLYALESDGVIRISTAARRAKTLNVRRDPRVSLTTVGTDFYRYVSAAGRASVVDHGVGPVLRRVYEVITGGPHPDWPEFDAAMVREERVILEVQIERLYPVSE